MKKKLIFLFVIGLPIYVSAQNATKKYIYELYSVWDSITVNYQIDHLAGDSTQAFHLFTNAPLSPAEDTAYSSSYAYLNQSVKQKEIDVLRGDIGLEATVAYTENLDPGFGYDDNIFYNRKVRAALGMDLLKGGLFDNHNKAKIKENELALLNLQAPQDEKNMERYLKWHNIIYQFNIQKIDVLNKRAALAEKRVEMATQLNLLKQVSQKDLISTLSSRAEINSMLQIYGSYNAQLANELNYPKSDINEFPLFDINYLYSYKLLAVEQPDSVTQLLLENIELDQKAIHEFRLRPFVAYNFYDLVGNVPPTRNYFSVGVTLAAPLNFNSGNKKELRAAQVELAKAPSVEKPEIQNDVLTQFYEFRYKLKQFSGLYQKRKMYEELIRIEKVKHDISPWAFNPVDALDILDQMMQVDIEMIDTKQQMYLKLLNIYTDLPYSEIESLLVPISFEENEAQNHKQSEGIYVWSSTIKKYSADVIWHYLELNNIKSAVISLNTNAESRSRAVKLIKLLNSKGVDVQVMIGKNTLINGGFTAYINQLKSGIDWSQISGIHLDVEPHTSIDWHQNKAAYMSKYHALLKEAKSYCESQNLKLAVSIPTHYPTGDIQKIYATVDMVYFMCYENVKTDFIVRKTNVYDMNKTIIALRTNDFTNRVELENKISEINTQMQPAGFIIHDLGSLIEFDKNALNRK